MWKPGQLVTIGRTVYRIRKRFFYNAKCAECKLANGYSPCVSKRDWKVGECVKIPWYCYPEQLKPKSQRVGSEQVNNL